MLLGRVMTRMGKLKRTHSDSRQISPDMFFLGHSDYKGLIILHQYTDGYICEWKYKNTSNSKKKNLNAKNTSISFEFKYMNPTTLGLLRCIWVFNFFNNHFAYYLLLACNLGNSFLITLKEIQNIGAVQVYWDQSQFSFHFK